MSLECRACGKLFGGEKGFNQHRTGAYTQKGPDYGRRCLSADELTAKGYGQNERGVWKDQRETWRGGRDD